MKQPIPAAEAADLQQAYGTTESRTLPGSDDENKVNPFAEAGSP